MPISSLPTFFSAAEPHRLSVLKALWPVITGEALANHSEIVGIQGDVARVRADSASWLKTLRDVRGTLILRLQAAAGPLAPRGLAFVEGPITPRPARRKVRAALAPLSPSSLPVELRKAAEALPTDEDRETYLRAVTSFKARFPAPPKS